MNSMDRYEPEHQTSLPDIGQFDIGGWSSTSAYEQIMMVWAHLREQIPPRSILGQNISVDGYLQSQKPK